MVRRERHQCTQRTHDFRGDPRGFGEFPTPVDDAMADGRERFDGQVLRQPSQQLRHGCFEVGQIDQSVFERCAIAPLGTESSVVKSHPIEVAGQHTFLGRPEAIHGEFEAGRPDVERQDQSRAGIRHRFPLRPW